MHHVREQGMEILLQEAFAHIRQKMHEEYLSLARRNNKLYGTTTPHFLWDGVVYPTRTATSTITIKFAVPGLPILHYSLLQELDDVNNLINIAGYPYIKNFYTAVLSATYSPEIMDELLPSFLVNKLKSVFNDAEYQYLAFGLHGKVNFKPSKDDLNAVVRLKQHYADTIIILRELLMDKFLLE